jgi:DNA-binding SARP family transcriptional activator
MMGIAVLGPLSIGGRSLAPRDRVVLAALTVRRGEVVGAAVLADALWREQPPTTWSKQIQASVVRLRRALGPGSIETEAGGYRLALPGDEIDVLRFERLVAPGQGGRRARRAGTLHPPVRRGPGAVAGAGAG